MPRRRTARALQPAPGERKRRREALRDVAYAVTELCMAQSELAAVPVDAPRFQRDVALLEPLARFALVRRFMDEVLKRYAWSSRDA